MRRARTRLRAPTGRGPPTPTGTTRVTATCRARPARSPRWASSGSCRSAAPRSCARAVASPDDPRDRVAVKAASRGARTARALEHALSALGILALGFCVWELGSACVHRVRGERRLASLAAAAASPLAPSVPAATRAEVARTGLVGRLEIPRVGLAAIVEEGVDQRTLRHAAGHLPGTALPGEAGNVVVAGHRDSFFQPLRNVRTGEALRFVTPDGVFEYTVVSLDVVSPSATDVLDQGTRPEATLITCYPFGYVGPAPQRFVVRAALADPARTSVATR